MENSEQKDGQNDKDERLNVEEYEREEQIVTAVFDQQQGEKLFRELNLRQSLVETKGRCCSIGDQHLVECTVWCTKIERNNEKR